MEIKKISRLELSNIPKKCIILKPDKVFLQGNDVLKIYNFHPKFHERKQKFFEYNIMDRLDVHQIEILSSLRDYIKGTKMVRGLIECSGVYIGVIYDYFMNYKDFTSLSTEETSLIFNNLKELVYKANELMSYDVYHTDIHPGNILYQGSDVQIIDIDGKYVSFNDIRETKVNRQLYDVIIDILYKKILTQYPEKDAILIKQEVIKTLGRMQCLSGITYKDIERIEDLKLIK